MGISPSWSNWSASWSACAARTARPAARRGRARRGSPATSVSWAPRSTCSVPTRSTAPPRLRGYVADGAVLPEPTGMAVCHATRGGIQYRLSATGGAAGMGFEGGPGTSALVALARVAAALDAAPRPAPLMQYLLRSGEELPWGTGDGLPAEGVLAFWAEI